MTLRIGSLATGYGGLDEAVRQVLDAELAWVSDIDPGACKILAHRYPDVPNLGDLTRIDWATVEPVHILTAGYPCQPFSQAGRRKGLEWMMMLPTGHVTDVPGLSRPQQLHALGNGVVPPQGAAALRWLLRWMGWAA